MRMPYKRYMTTTFVVGYHWFLNSINLLPNFLLENYSLLYMFPGFIWPKVERLDVLKGIKGLVKSAQFWCKMALGPSILSSDFRPPVGLDQKAGIIRNDTPSPSS